MPANVRATRVGPITRAARSSVCLEKSLAHLWMGRESSLTLICIGTSINRGFGCDMGNVESFVAMSPINGEGLLISSADKRLVSAEAPQATGGERCIPDGA